MRPADTVKSTANRAAELGLIGERDPAEIFCDHLAKDLGAAIADTMRTVTIFSPSTCCHDPLSEVCVQDKETMTASRFFTIFLMTHTPLDSASS